MKRASAEYLFDLHRQTVRWHARAPELLEAARRGDPDAEKRAFLAYGELAAIIALHLGSATLATEDVVQEALVVLRRLIDDGTEPLVLELAPEIALALRRAEAHPPEPAG
jgi:hypothetical protein